VKDYKVRGNPVVGVLREDAVTSVVRFFALPEDADARQGAGSLSEAGHREKEVAEERSRAGVFVLRLAARSPGVTVLALAKSGGAHGQFTNCRTIWRRGVKTSPEETASRWSTIRSMQRDVGGRRLPAAKIRLRSRGATAISCRRQLTAKVFLKYRPVEKLPNMPMRPVHGA